MKTMDSSILDLLNQGMITAEDALGVLSDSENKEKAFT